MSIRSLALTCAIIMTLLTTPAGFSFAQANGPAAEGLAVDFKDIELTELIQTVSEITGKNFIFDESVRGKVTIISPHRMTMEEAYQVFLSVLNVKGYTVVPSGSTNKIVHINNARESNLPVPRGGDIGGGEHYVTRLLPLQNIDAGEIATTVLLPLIPKTGNIVAYTPTNTLIITDSAANIMRLEQIVRQLDIPGNSEGLEVIELEFANADEVAKLVTQLIAQTTTGRVGRRTAKVATAGETPSGKVLAFPPTNSLVVMAAADETALVKTIVARLDQKPSQSSAGIQVYYLENADAETLATTLNEILTGMKNQARGNGGAARPGQPQAQQQQQALGPVTITADKPTNALIINSTPEEFRTIRDIIGQLDVKRKQVYVEALILELSMDATKRVGASLQGAAEPSPDKVVFGRTDLGNVSASGPADLLASTINGILLGGIFNPITVTGPDGEPVTVPALSALIDLSKQDGDVNILSAPKLLTSDNEEAEIVVGQNVPIITSRLSDVGGTSLAQSVAVERKDVALTLRFTPQITEGNLVRLNVFQEVTDLAQTNVGNVNDVGPTFTTRKLRNTVLAENGRTVVLGGLISSNVQERVSKVPLLGDIPILGWAFKRKSTTEEKRNLLIFITPHIIRDAAGLAEVTGKAKRALDQFQATEIRDRETRSAWTEEQILLEPVIPAGPAGN